MGSPELAAPRRYELAVPRRYVGLLALFGVATTLWLVIWAVAPAILLGWNPVVLTSGSMSPGLRTGDIVVAEPHDGEGLGPGTIVVFDDPTRPGYLTHRIVALTPDGAYVTRGDANPRIDSTPLAPDRVVGVGRLHVPLVGLPMVWLWRGAWLQVAMVTLMLAGAIWCCRWGVFERFDPWVDKSPGRSYRARAGAAPSSSRPSRILPGLRTVALAVGLMVGLAGVVLSLVVLEARAAFSDTTSNAGNSFLLGQPTFRVTTYEIRDAVFTGTDYLLTLRQALASDYFVVLRGAAGANDSGTNRNPDQNYARVTGDPHGNFAAVTASDEIRLSREAAASSWQGQVTVIEGVGDAASSGFALLDVVEVTLGSGATSGSATSSPAWADINQVGLYGGIRGGGVSTTTGTRADHMTAWARIYPSGTNTVNLERQAGGGGSLSGTTTWSVYVVEWGSEWTIQRATVSGAAGGQGANLTSHYVTGPISPVSRANTFVLAYGHNTDNGIGDGWEGQTWTLGDGVNQNATESQVAVGAEYVDSRTADVYVHTHPELRGDYRFGTDGGTPGIPSTALTGTAPIDPAAGTETYDNTSTVRFTAGYRFTIIANTLNGTGTAYPRPMVWSRPTDPTTATWTRSRSGQPGAFWLQAVDFVDIWH